MLVDRWGFQFLIQIDGDDDGIKFFFIEDSIKIRKFLLMFWRGKEFWLLDFLGRQS